MCITSNNQIDGESEVRIFDALVDVCCNLKICKHVCMCT